MRRYLIPVGIVVLLVVVLGGIKAKQIAGLVAAGAQAKQKGPPPEQVGTTDAKLDTWEGTISTVGSVAAVRGVAVSNEVAGTVTAIRFESGQVVRAGQVLVELDTSVERAQLASIRARKELAEISLQRSQKLAAGAAISKAQLDADEAGLKTSSADLAALQAQIERKTVRAPFAGRLGIRAVNLGQFLSPGTTLSVLESQGAVYIDFSLPQEELARVKVGTPVRVALAPGARDLLDGTIAAIDPTIESSTRNIKLRATVTNQAERLHAGMFVQVGVVLPEVGQVVTAPVTAVVHAAYGDSVFVVEDAPAGKEGKVVRQQFVRLGPQRGDFVAFVDGVRAGQTLVTAGAFKLRNGAGVVVRNEVAPTPALQPKVENR